VVVLAAALALAGCGRKGPLELPPNTPPQAAAAAQANADHEPAAAPSVFDPSYGTNAAPAAPKGAKKPFLMDPLLNSN
jgi:predicted small lipoprotein YifL